MLLDTLSRNWWVFALRGVAAVIFGILALLMPGVTLAVLVLLFGAYAIVDGASMIVGLARHGMAYMRQNWALGIVGLLGIVAGVIAFVLPGLTALSLLFLVAGWAIVMGVFQVIAAIDMRRQIDNEWWLILGGALTVLFGLYLAVFPGDGLLTLVWLVGFWSIVFGVSSLLLAWRLRGMASGMSARPA